MAATAARVDCLQWGVEETCRWGDKELQWSRPSLVFIYHMVYHVVALMTWCKRDITPVRFCIKPLTCLTMRSHEMLNWGNLQLGIRNYNDPDQGLYLPCGNIDDLTRRPWTKWLPFWQTTFSKACIFLMTISLNFFPRSPIDNNAALVQVMAWRWRSDKPLSEPMVAQFTDAYMWH